MIAPILLALVAASQWIWSLWTNRARGLDASDEAYYLLAALRPSASTASGSDFGFYLHPLLVVADGSVAWLRVLGAVMIVVASVTVAAAVSRPLATVHPTRSRRLLVVAATSVLVLASTLVYYGLWLTTPSYNLLGLVLMLLAAACLIAGGRIMTTSDSRPDSARDAVARLWPIAALGVVLVLGLMIKAPSFLAATVMCAGCIVVLAGRQSPVALLVMLGGAIIGLGVHWGLVADAPLTDLRRLRRGSEVYRLLQSHSAREVWETDVLRETVLPWMLWLAVGVLALLLIWRRVRSPSVRLALLALASCVSFVLLWSDRPDGGPALISDAAGWWWLRAGVITLVWTTAASPRTDRVLIVGPTVAVLGLAGSLGTNNGFIRQLGMTSGLIAVGVLAQVVVVAMMHRPQVRALVAVPAATYFVLASVASVGVLEGAQNEPYRLGAVLTRSDQHIDLGRFGPLYVTEGTAAYVAELQSLAGRLTDEHRACLVDLTGGTPLSAIALDARPAGSQWLVGGYEGSAEAASYWLEADPCIDGPLALLEAPGGERSISRPDWLVGRELRPVGEVLFRGDDVEQQILSVSVD